MLYLSGSAPKGPKNAKYKSAPIEAGVGIMDNPTSNYLSQCAYYPWWAADTGIVALGIVRRS